MLWSCVFHPTLHLNKSERAWTMTLIFWNIAPTASMYKSSQVTLMSWETWEQMAATTQYTAVLKWLQSWEEDVLCHHTVQPLLNYLKPYILKRWLTFNVRRCINQTPNVNSCLDVWYLCRCWRAARSFGFSAMWQTDLGTWETVGVERSPEALCGWQVFTPCRLPAWACVITDLARQWQCLLSLFSYLLHLGYTVSCSTAVKLLPDG